MKTVQPVFPYVRITAPAVDRAVYCAGAAWAGVSEVPRADLTDAQMVQLKLDKSLRVEEFERPHVVEA